MALCKSHCSAVKNYVYMQRKTDSGVWERWKSHGLHQRPVSSEPLPTQIGHTELPRNVRVNNGVNSREFLCVALRIVPRGSDESYVCRVLFQCLFPVAVSQSVWVWILGQQAFQLMTWWWCHPCGRFQFFCSISVWTEQQCCVEIKRLRLCRSFY